MKERMIVWIVAWVSLFVVLISVITFCSISLHWDEVLAGHFIRKGATPKFVAELNNALYWGLD